MTAPVEQPAGPPPPLPPQSFSAAASPPVAFSSPTDRLVFGRDADLPSGIKKPSGYSLRALAIIVSILVGLVLWLAAMHYLSVWFGISYLSMKSVWSLTPLLFPAGLALWIGYNVVRSYRAKRLIGELPKKLDPGSGRLQAVGKPRHLAPLVQLGALRDEAFEPIILFAPRIWPMPKVATGVLVATAILVAGLIELLHQTTTLPLVRPGWLTVMVGIATGFAVQMLVWPTYARITPGRLDIMRFPLAVGKPTVTTIDLRNARVHADMGKTALLIRPDRSNMPPTPPTAPTEPPSEPEWALLNLRGVWKPAELVHAVCRGAVSTAPAAPLPDDRLIG